MSHVAELTRVEEPPRSPRSVSRRFQAIIGRFADVADCKVIDELAEWVEQRYREDLRQRPSKHVYIRTLPSDAVARINRLRESPVIQDAILEQFDADWVITPMQHTDELYISHYNKDFGGDHGLFAKHYDGNLRFLSVGAVVRALIYLRSDTSYTVVFGDSKVQKAFETYDFGLLDFHRELHWVEGEYQPSGEQRILLKCNFLVAPRNAATVGKALMAANTAVFYVVKAAMEYSKSPRNPLQRAVGLLCNITRVLNNVHPLVPLALVALAAVSTVYAIGHLLL